MARKVEVEIDMESEDRGDGRSPDASGFDDLYRREWAGLVALGWSLTGRWMVAEGLAQDAFADAYRRWDEVSRLDRPGAWVRRAVINRAASLSRHRGVERRGLLRLASRTETSGDGAHVDHTGDTATDRIGDPIFWAAVRALPDRQRACVALALPGGPERGRHRRGSGPPPRHREGPPPPWPDRPRPRPRPARR